MHAGVQNQGFTPGLGVGTGLVQQVELIANKKALKRKRGKQFFFFRLDFPVTNSYFGVIFMIYHPAANITMSLTSDHNES